MVWRCMQTGGGNHCPLSRAPPEWAAAVLFTGPACSAEREQGVHIDAALFLAIITDAFNFQALIKMARCCDLRAARCTYGTRDDLSYSIMPGMVSISWRDRTSRLLLDMRI